jgi:hypothetical protein
LEPSEFPLATTSSGAELGKIHDFDGTAADLERCKNHTAGANYAGNFLLPLRATPVDLGGNITLALADIGTIYRKLGIANYTVTVPTNVAVPFPIGTMFGFFRQNATFYVDVKGDAGVTIVGYIHNTGPLLLNSARTGLDYSNVWIMKIATNTWIAFGSFSQGA